MIDDDALDRAAIEDLHRRDAAASLNQDYFALRQLMDDEAIVLAPGAAPVSGRSKLDQHLGTVQRRQPIHRILEYRFEWAELQILGTHAIEWGQIHGEMEDIATGERTRQAYNVLRVLRKHPEAGWRVYRTIWNDAPFDDNLIVGALINDGE
jgi:ketosteroid isomerase-like protein